MDKTYSPDELKALIEHMASAPSNGTESRKPAGRSDTRTSSTFGQGDVSTVGESSIPTLEKLRSRKLTKLEGYTQRGSVAEWREDISRYQEACSGASLDPTAAEQVKDEIENRIATIYQGVITLSETRLHDPDDPLVRWRSSFDDQWPPLCDTLQRPLSSHNDEDRKTVDSFCKHLRSVDRAREDSNRAQPAIDWSYKVFGNLGQWKELE